MTRSEETYCYFSELVTTDAAKIELEESTMWGGFDSEVEESTKKSSILLTNNESNERTCRGVMVGSLPVNVPSWSRMADENNEDDDEEDGGTVVPPHEYLRRRMGGVVPFSVHEGVGRTLKGRDLCRVRNAVWGNVGFQD